MTRPIYFKFQPNSPINLMYELIIFDWDGTLMDSAQKIANCIKASARDLGVEEPSDEQAKNIIGLSLVEAMQILFPTLNHAQISKLVESYKYHFVKGDPTQQKVFAGVEQGLQQLSEAGAILAVATGKSRAGMTRVFDELDLRQHFVISRCADETRSKPHPQMLHEILEFTAIEPHKSIMVGDTTYDMQMASNAGVTGLGVSYGVHSEESLRLANAIDVVTSFQQVIEWFMYDRISVAYSQ